MHTQQSENFMAAYLDAGSALRIDPTLEKEVTFSFTLRKSPDQKAAPICRKEATFTFNKGADNRGWKECVPASQVEDGQLYFTVEVREGSVASENITITVKLESHPDCPLAIFKVKPSTAMARLMESYCSKHHFRPDKVKLIYMDKKTGMAKQVEADQSASDLDMSLENEELLAYVKDEEVEAVMKRAAVGLLEAAEAMEKCSFQPRKALQQLDSQKRAREQAEKAAAKEREKAEVLEAETTKTKELEAETTKLFTKDKDGGEAEVKKKVHDIATDGVSPLAAPTAAPSAAGAEHRPESAFPSRHSLASKEDEKAEELPEPKAKKKGKKNESFGFEELDAPGPKTVHILKVYPP
jgi:hypothetical protein